MKKRVVITGIGAITPIGNNVDELWKGIEENKCGIAPLTQIDATEFKTKLGAEVKNFDEEKYFEPKQIKKLDRVIKFAIVAAR